AIPGYSICHFADTAGTFGCLVKKRGDKKSLYILSNSHVLANSGLGAIGDEILQPGPFDGGTTTQDVIASLAEWVPFQFSAAGYPNLVDAAIAKVRSAKSVTSAIRIVGVPNGVSRTVRRGMQVQKAGRTTDYTIGLIRDVNFRVALSFNMPGGGKGRVGFRDQVLCTRYSAVGDSGSAVLNKKRQVVGLHFAGSPSTSIFNRIGDVLDALQIDIVTIKI
ncbi:MAG: trypsin-like serine protease, partial [Pirellulales bacterium]